MDILEWLGDIFKSQELQNALQVIIGGIVLWFTKWKNKADSCLGQFSDSSKVLLARIDDLTKQVEEMKVIEQNKDQSINALCEIVSTGFLDSRGITVEAKKTISNSVAKLENGGHAIIDFVAKKAKEVVSEQIQETSGKIISKVIDKNKENIAMSIKEAADIDEATKRLYDNVVLNENKQ